MTDLLYRYEALASDLNQKKGKAELVKAELASHRDNFKRLEILSTLESETQKLLVLAASATWSTTKQLVEGLVTRAMKAIFSDRDYKFCVKQDVKRGSNAVSFFVIDAGMELDLVDELGGGISDVVALVLRIAFLSLHRPRLTPLLVLDEPLKHLAVNYQPAAGRFLKQVCHELELTILITTHSKELSREADQLFRARNIENVCVVEEESTICDH